MELSLEQTFPCTLKVSETYLLPLTARLRFVACDPFVTRFIFPRGNGEFHTWAVGIELLFRAVYVGSAHAEGGDIRLQVDELKDQFRLHLSTPEGTATIAFSVKDMDRFLTRVMAL